MELDPFPNATVYSTCEVAPALGCTPLFSSVIREHIARHPEHGGRVQAFDRLPSLDGKAAYGVFYQNISAILEAAHRDRAPFAFTLYPGGWFLVSYTGRRCAI